MSAPIYGRSACRGAFIGLAAPGGALLIFHLALRSYSLLKISTPPVHFFPRLFLGSFYDVLYCVALTLLFGLLFWIVRRRLGSAKLVQHAFLGVVIFSVLAAAIGFEFAEIARTPFSYQWLYYSDFLLSLDAREAIQANLSWMSALVAILLVASAVGLSFALQKAMRLLQPQAFGSRRFVLIATGCLAIYLPAAGWYVESRHMPEGTYDNAVLYFLKSCLIAPKTPAIFTMKTSVGNSDFLPVADRPFAQPDVSRPSTPQIRNVILFVMESVGAEYTQPFGGKYPVTPTLNRYRTKAASFANIYASAPMTVNSLWSLECSIYPWISPKLIVREAPQIHVPSLSSELRKRGYQTAFFNSSDNRYQSSDLFLSARGFNLVQDCRTLSGNQPILRGSSRTVGENGCDDRLTADALNRWIDAQGDQSFFGMLWTVMTHYPYFTKGKVATYSENPDLDRYLNALRIGDEALGKVLTHLEERGLMDSTLVIVIGDHGEAFGRHGCWNHENVYDETVRVPLMLINPRLFHGESYSQLSGSVDVAPTILELLGQTSPSAWQGRSLFSKDRPNRAYFFEPLTGYWFGYRENDLVCLYLVSRNKYEIYDMAKDPLQMNNLADQRPELVRLGTERLASWVQFQNTYIERLMFPGTRAAATLQATR